jgi:hypothetical protein
MNHELANGREMWKGNESTTTLLFSLKRLEIVNQEIRGQVKTIIIPSSSTSPELLTSSIPTNWINERNKLLMNTLFYCVTYKLLLLF